MYYRSGFCIFLCELYDFCFHYQIQIEKPLTLTLMTNKIIDIHEIILIAILLALYYTIFSSLIKKLNCQVFCVMFYIPTSLDILYQENNIFAH